jgi:hypothetical protein
MWGLTGFSCGKPDPAGCALVTPETPEAKLSYVFSIICKRLSAYIYENVLSSYLNPIRGHADSRVLFNLAGRDIVLPSMPGTGDNISLKNSLPQRSPPMQAGVANGVECPSDMSYRDTFPVHLKFADCPWRDIRRFSSQRKRHFSLLSVPGPN